MINNNGFSLGSTLTNQDIALTYTPPKDVYSFEYTVYKDGAIYLENTNVTAPVNFYFTDTGSYNIEIQLLDANSVSSLFTSSLYVIDKEKPIISLKNHDITIKEGKSFDVYSNVSASDNRDGNITSSITTNYSNINFNTLGQKKLVYTVTDLSGNTSTATTYINVTAKPNFYMYYVTGGIIIALLVCLVLVMRYRNAIKIENRISKFSVDALNNDDISLFDKVYAFINKYIKKKSLLFSKFVFLKKYSKFFEKYTVIYNKDLTSMDFVSIKATFAGLVTLTGIISYALKFQFLSPYMWIVPFIAGLVIIDIYWAIKYKIYRDKIENDLLQAIIIMNNAFKSGRSISQAVELVTTELTGPIAKEFSKIYVELSFGLDLNTVFKRFSDRIKIEEALYLTTSLTILNKTGGNIVKVFSAIERSLFNKKKLKLELNAITSSSKIIKNVLFVVPVAFFMLISLMDNTYFKTFFSSELGITLLVIILLIYAVYVYVVNKIMKVRM